MWHIAARQFAAARDSGELSLFIELISRLMKQTTDRKSIKMALYNFHEQ